MHKYFITGLDSDRRTYLSACSAVRDSITRSRADHIKSKLDEVAGDVGATWRTAQSLLHSNHQVVYSDAECANLLSTFYQFFANKVNRIRDSIAMELQSTFRHILTDRPQLGPTFSPFQPVTTEEVRRLLSAMPSKSSPAGLAAEVVW